MLKSFGEKSRVMVSTRVDFFSQFFRNHQFFHLLTTLSLVYLFFPSYYLLPLSSPPFPPPCSCMGVSPVAQDLPCA